MTDYWQCNAYEWRAWYLKEHYTDGIQVMKWLLLRWWWAVTMVGLIYWRNEGGRIYRFSDLIPCSMMHGGMPVPVPTCRDSPQVYDAFPYMQEVPGCLYTTATWRNLGEGYQHAISCRDTWEVELATCPILGFPIHAFPLGALEWSYRLEHANCVSTRTYVVLPASWDLLHTTVDWLPYRCIVLVTAILIMIREHYRWYLWRYRRLQPAIRYLLRYTTDYHMEVVCLIDHRRYCAIRFIRYAPALFWVGELCSARFVLPASGRGGGLELCRDYLVPRRPWLPAGLQFLLLPTLPILERHSWWLPFWRPDRYEPVPLPTGPASGTDWFDAIHCYYVIDTVLNLPVIYPAWIWWCSVILLLFGGRVVHCHPARRRPEGSPALPLIPMMPSRVDDWLPEAVDAQRRIPGDATPGDRLKVPIDLLLHEFSAATFRWLIHWYLVTHYLWCEGPFYSICPCLLKLTFVIPGLTSDTVVITDGTMMRPDADTVVRCDAIVQWLAIINVWYY